jgi:acetyltransferase-like isoleucine patch superfamily enzyme
MLLLKDKKNAFHNKSIIVDNYTSKLEIVFKKSTKYRALHNNIYFEDNASLESNIFGGKHNIFIGAYSTINDGGYIRIDQGGVFIGRYCSIGRRVTIAAGMHNMHKLTTSNKVKGCDSAPYSINESKFIYNARRPGAIFIESDVWIGDGAIIMPAVKLGVGCVIGANAVITKDVLPYQIVGGVPAREISKRFSDDIIQELIKSQWWESDYDYLNSLPTSNIFEFLKEYKNISYEFKTYAFRENEDRI